MNETLEQKIEKVIKEKEEITFAYKTLEIGFKRYWEFFNYAPDGYIVTDIEGNIKEANQTVLAMLSAKEADLKEKPIGLFIPEIKEKDLGLQLNWFSGSQTLEVFLQPQESAPFYASLSIAPQYNSRNKTIGLLWLVRDITENKEKERVLRKSERFNSSLLQNSPHPIAVINTDTSIAYINPALERLTGFTSAQILGCTFPYPWCLKNGPAKIKEIKPRDSHKVGGKNEEHFQKYNGERFWVEVNTTLIENKDEPDRYLQTWVDITESRRLKENLEFYMMQITRVQEEERKRIAQELHEETLQSLAALCLETEGIIKNEGGKSPEINRQLQQLIDKLNLVINQVRRFSYDLRPGVLDYLGLTAALETLIDELNEEGFKANLEISGKEISLSPEMEITLFRITQEAVNNIKKHSQAVKVTISINYGSAKIRLKINDNGRGFKLPESLTELAAQGKLGLIGIEQRTRLYGGAFSIESEPQKGTELTIILSTNPLSHLY
jgi:PAS domain S-box-containing protein